MQVRRASQPATQEKGCHARVHARVEKRDAAASISNEWAAREVHRAPWSSNVSFIIRTHKRADRASVNPNQHKELCVSAVGNNKFVITRCAAKQAAFFRLVRENTRRALFFLLPPAGCTRRIMKSRQMQHNDSPSFFLFSTFRHALLRGVQVHNEFGFEKFGCQSYFASDPRSQSEFPAISAAERRRRLGFTIRIAAPGRYKRLSSRRVVNSSRPCRGAGTSELLLFYPRSLQSSQLDGKPFSRSILLPHIVLINVLALGQNFAVVSMMLRRAGI